MADGSISLELDARIAALLTRAAEAAEQPPAQFAARLISEALAEAHRKNLENKQPVRKQTTCSLI
jgi:hypothetical protein